MAVASVFEFRFSPDAAREGVDIARAIGADMPATAGCTGYDVITDIADPGHVIVLTRWNTQGEGEAVLSSYIHDPKVTRATELLQHAPEGFLGELASVGNHAIPQL